jgi:protease IV
MPRLSRRPLLLELDLTRPLGDAPAVDLLDRLRSRGRPRLGDVLDALHRAGDDRRVVGLVAKLGSGLSLAAAQELRAAVRAFAASGKPTVAWAETFGEQANASAAYLLATGFGEIWLQPSGELGLVGLATETTFLGGAVQRLGVEPQVGQRLEYKNAPDQLTRTAYSDAHREAQDRLVASGWEQVLDAVATGRGLSPERVQELADRAPLDCRAALDAGLVDRRGYRDEVYADLRRRVGDEASLLFVQHWAGSRPAPTRVAETVRARRAPVVGVVEVTGGIVVGRSRRSALQGPMVGSDTVGAQLRAARRDDRVRAVLLRVDSPGGSYVASDTIWREVGLTRDAGKPVVVSMGRVAGSGGYFVSCGADAIVAEPATVTGSIGVFGGKVVLSGLLERYGVSTDAVERGARSRMHSTRRRFSDDEQAALAEWLDAVYADFTGKVAAGRGLDVERVHEIARGRVWTGADALGLGLVDALGGRREALARARREAGLPADAPVRPVVVAPTLPALRPPRSSEDPRSDTAVGLGWPGNEGLAGALGLAAGDALLCPVGAL